MNTPLEWDKFGTEAIGYLKELLRIDTTNPPGNERPAAEMIGHILEREGIAYQILEKEPGRGNLVARLPGLGEGGPLLLNGHLDVVPANPKHWTHGPFDAEEADGCIWGRGAIDMKHMVIMSTMALVLLKRGNKKLNRDVILSLVADEEEGSERGALFLVEEYPELVRADYVLNEVGGHTFHFGDARFYPVQVSEKGICWFRLTARGESGHSSMPHPANAIVRLARAIEALGRMRLPLHITPVVQQFLQTLAQAAPFPQSKLLPLLTHRRISGRLLDLFQRLDLERALPINAMLRNTASPTMLAGGEKINVLPTEVSVKVDGRVMPGQNQAQFLKEIERVVGDLDIEVLKYRDGNTFNTHTPLYDTICRILSRHDRGCVPVPYMIPGFTDAFAYARLGATCYGFAPLKLSRDLNFGRMFHGIDERIPVDGFRWGLRVLYEVVEEFCTERPSEA